MRKEVAAPLVQSQDVDPLYEIYDTLAPCFDELRKVASRLFCQFFQLDYVGSQLVEVRHLMAPDPGDSRTAERHTPTVNSMGSKDPIGRVRALVSVLYNTIRDDISKMHDGYTDYQQGSSDPEQLYLSLRGDFAKIRDQLSLQYCLYEEFIETDYAKEYTLSDFTILDTLCELIAIDQQLFLMMFDAQMALAAELAEIPAQRTRGEDLQRQKNFEQVVDDLKSLRDRLQSVVDKRQANRADAGSNQVNQPWIAPSRELSDARNSVESLEKTLDLLEQQKSSIVLTKRFDRFESEKNAFFELWLPNFQMVRNKMDEFFLEMLDATQFSGMQEVEAGKLVADVIRQCRPVDEIADTDLLRLYRDEPPQRDIFYFLLVANETNCLEQKCHGYKTQLIGAVNGFKQFCQGNSAAVQEDQELALYHALGALYNLQAQIRKILKGGNLSSVLGTVRENCNRFQAMLHGVQHLELAEQIQSHFDLYYQMLLAFIYSYAERFDDSIFNDQDLDYSRFAEDSLNHPKLQLGRLITRKRVELRQKLGMESTAEKVTFVVPIAGEDHQLDVESDTDSDEEFNSDANEANSDSEASCCSPGHDWLRDLQASLVGIGEFDSPLDRRDVDYLKDTYNEWTDAVGRGFYVADKTRSLMKSYSLSADGVELPHDIRNCIKHGLRFVKRNLDKLVLPKVFLPELNLQEGIWPPHYFKEYRVNQWVRDWLTENIYMDLNEKGFYPDALSQHDKFYLPDNPTARDCVVVFLNLLIIPVINLFMLAVNCTLLGALALNHFNDGKHFISWESTDTPLTQLVHSMVDHVVGTMPQQAREGLEHVLLFGSKDVEDIPAAPQAEALGH